MARGLKFRIYKEEGLYYLCSENKGADQLRGYREADLRLCFRIYKKPVFSQRGSYSLGNHDSDKLIMLTRPCSLDPLEHTFGPSLPFIQDVIYIKFEDIIQEYPKCLKSNAFHETLL